MREKKSLLVAMMASISEVLEKMFFLPLEFSEDAKLEEWWPSGRENLLVSKLTFMGPLSGTFLFFIPKTLAHSLAANFMGEDEETVDEPYVGDTVKEIVNMIAGSTFGNLDSKTVFDLDLPEMISYEKAERQHSESGDRVFVGITTIDDVLAAEMIMNS